MHDATEQIAIMIHNTYWEGYNTSLDQIARLAETDAGMQATQLGVISPSNLRKTTRWGSSENAAKADRPRFPSSS